MTRAETCGVCGGLGREYGSGQDCVICGGAGCVYVEPSEINQRPIRNVHDLYCELLFAVAYKYEGETRHETALRYIREKEAIREAEGCAKGA